MKKSFADMVRSLGLMAVIVAALLFIGARYLIMPGSADRMPAVDYSGTAMQICFNADYVDNFLGVVQTDGVLLEFKR